MNRVSPHNAPNLPSNGTFGVFLTAVIIALAVWFYWRSNINWALIFVTLALAVGLLTLASPRFLAPLNRRWYALGLMLGSVTNLIALGLIYLLLITPTSLIGRLLGRDELRLKKRFVQSYWQERSPHGPSPDSFKNQY